MSVLTQQERDQARTLGNQLITLITSVNPLVAGFALLATIQGLPQPLRDAMRVAEAAYQRGLSFARSAQKH